MEIFTDITQRIGKTPLVQLSGFEKREQLPARILAKLELHNPTGSVKDRAALAMVESAENKGLLYPGAVIVEPTSGNTGIALAAIGAARGYRIILTMPDTMSKERRQLLKAYGAELVLTEGSRGMRGAIEKANAMAESMSGIVLGQFSNPANPEIHYTTTGPEIWEDAEGEIDVLVAGVGTGGTLSGVGKYLKEQKPSIRVIAVEPASSPVLSGGSPGPHTIQGIGAGFVPENLDREIYNEIVTVSDRDAISTARALATSSGILAGISSGAALWAAAKTALKEINEGKTIVVILPDMGDRYLSTALSAETN